MSTKYIFVTGGVLSGLGKGIVAASLGNILKHRGYKVFIQKFDPYLNVDAGTLNPAEHGECFVTADGAETDLDLGHYERFLDEELTRDSSIMSGSIYRSVIEKERQGKFLGKTVQVIPHVTNEVKERVYQAAEKSGADILITEIGGTVGDIESTHFIEAIRQISVEKRGDVAFVHLGYLPYLPTSHELKSKPMQNSIHDLQARGIRPDMVFCRSDYPVGKSQLEKVALSAGLKEETVIPLETVDTIYFVPSLLAQAQADKILLRTLNLPLRQLRPNGWGQLISQIRRPRTKDLTIALVGKYMTMADTYFSVIEALKAACWKTPYRLNLQLIDSERIEKEGTEPLKKLDGIIIPGGFGNRGIEGMVTATRYAREQGTPLLGICLGMQIATIEYARHVLKLTEANSAEFDKNSPDPVIHIMDSQIEKLLNNSYGATMRLGNFNCQIAPDTRSHKLYHSADIIERHRHRYEFNNNYRSLFEKDDNFIIAGQNLELNLVELIELKNHPFFIASQFHPEFKSRPNRSHPLFIGLVKAAIKNQRDSSKVKSTRLHSLETR